MPPFPSLTKTWHSRPHPAIDPTRPELSAKGKVVCITGGGGAIGGATALAFARAGATKIAIIGRRDGPLHETEKRVDQAVPGTRVLCLQGDISSEESIQGALGTVRSELGPIDVLVSNAGYLAEFQPLEKAEPQEWWKGFEINVKGAFNLSRAFLSVAAAEAILVDVSSCVVQLPAMITASSYVSSKLAATKIYETFGRENEAVSVVHVHPGVVHSELNVKSGVPSFDEADLPGCFMVWAVSPEASFLRGKYLWCNWDVDELKSRREEFEQPNQLCITLNGWPFGAGDGNPDSPKG